MNEEDSGVFARLLADDGIIPNNSRFPLLVYPNAVALSPHDPAARFEELFSRNEWTGCWRNGVFSFHHYHFAAHEVLGVYSGQARIQLGGKSGISEEVNAGDVIIIPAGVGHCKLRSSPSFAVVGAYPKGQNSVIGHGEPGDSESHRRAIAATGLPTKDPVYGASGPLFEHWV
jgi:uncharacterized protein YjlB